jgi:hypothetical protein
MQTYVPDQSAERKTSSHKFPLKQSATSYFDQQNFSATGTISSRFQHIQQGRLTYVRPLDDDIWIQQKSISKRRVKPIIFGDQVI